MDLSGRSTIVTGAAMGIGRYIALGLAERGADVAIADIDEEGVRSVEQELSRYGHGVVASVVDVRNEPAVESFMATVAREFGTIDYLVNNAGVVPHFQWGGPRWPRLEEMDLSFWQKVIGTNLEGTFICSKHAIPYMRRQASGHIVALHGGGGPTPPGALAYVVTKEALVWFARYLAEEVRDANICVMSISPGAAIATERAPDEARSRMPGPDFAGDRFVLAADAPMDLSGHLLDLVDGALVAIG